MARFAQRRDRLRRLLREMDCPAILITNPVNVTYLTGFSGEDSYLLVLGQGAVLLSDARFTTQLKEECPDLDVATRGPGTTMLEHATRSLRKTKVQRVAFEAEAVNVATLTHFERQLTRVTWVPTSGQVEQLRAVKDREEITAIRHAIRCAERAFGVIRAALRNEQTELQVAADLEYQIRQFGGRGCSFPSIVAVGPRAALPHAAPTRRPIGGSDFVLVDWGAHVDHYVSDLTRLLVTGRISPKLERIYGVVLQSQRRAIDMIKPGVRRDAVDAAARAVIAEAGYGKNFGHGLGHGIGLEVHEGPRLSAGQQDTLQTGMVITIEPGIYLPGWGGVRIEDDVLVTRNGHEVLTSLSADLADTVVG